MTHQWAEGARIARARSGRMVSVASLALLAPLMLSACVSDGDKLSGTADISPTKTSGTKSEVVQIAKNDNGPTRVIAPSAKPSEKSAEQTEQKGGRVVAARAEVAEAKPSLGSRAYGTAVAAKNSVVAGAVRVGEKAVAVANVSAATIQNVAQAAKDTITGDPKIDRMIAAAADENEIPRELAYAVVRVESHYNPRARGAGVYGLSQIKPATARGLGFSGPAEALLDPETNLRYGMRYLKGAYEEGNGDICRTAMKYKGGHRTTVMSKSASVYCSNVKRHMAEIRSRKTPAMSDTASLVAAVEPTVRKGLVARAVAAHPAEARGEVKPTVAATLSRPQSTNAPAAATALTGTDEATSGAIAAVSAPVPAPRPIIRLAENHIPPLIAPQPAEAGAPDGSRVTHRSQPEIDRDRFGGAFDASTRPAQ
ncbi:lytic transglycosylase domain-containing protein [Aureimonas ureilytica]|uniref:lytic transglycosylase domain-containing protein n=1 Tax=Aureimonas ureilytica TaxID=401562 RepID=UPI000ADAD287|nr:transglycosylase SLT domain-containing protein [Aureimonas ureilytica]